MRIRAKPLWIRGRGMNTAKIIRLFDGNLMVTVSASDWDYMCKHRFCTDDPSEEDIRAEFVTGTGITSKRTNLWPEASIRFHEYVDDLREISKLDINKMARDLIAEKEKIACI